jgi:diguanylate cyclase (GGDEF)-like protein
MKTCEWQDIHQLRQTRLFRNVALQDLNSLLGDLRACELERGEILLSPSCPNDHLYILVQGRLDIRLGQVDNPTVNVIRPGDCAGEISFIDNERPCAYVVAGEDSIALGLHRERLLRLMEKSPALTKNLLGLLCDRVRQGNQIIQDVEQNANIDSLTGLYNRRWLRQMYERESTRCAFDESPLCMLMLDVDHFKSYNDTHGHLAGDYALSMVSHTLRKQLRPKDSMARYGGEEFVILLPDLGLTETCDIGERLRQSMERVETFYSPQGALPGVTISIGVAQMKPKDSLESLISRADKALYRAKQDGRNRLCA